MGVSPCGRDGGTGCVGLASTRCCSAVVSQSGLSDFGSNRRQPRLQIHRLLQQMQQPMNNLGCSSPARSCASLLQAASLLGAQFSFKAVR